MNKNREKVLRQPPITDYKRERFFYHGPMTFLLRLIVFVFMAAASAQAGDIAPSQKLKLPDYYIGHWTTAAARSGDDSYFLRCDGSGEARWNHDKKEKFQDIFYRVLSVTEEEALLFVKEIDTQKSIAIACGNNKKCIEGVRNPHYQYWLLSPSTSSVSGSKMIKIKEYGWDYDAATLAGILNPFEKSDQQLKDIYLKPLDWSSTSYYYFESSLPCVDK